MNNKDKIHELAQLEDKEEWQKAIRLAKSLFKSSPNDHWLLTRIGTNYYEAHQYITALRYSEKALKIAPNCPLALWDYACCLDMLNKEKEAIRIWQNFLKRSVKAIAYGECGEGMRWTESLLNDCRFRIGNSYSRLGKKALATKYLKAHLASRRPGLPSIYSKRDVKKELSNLLDSTSSVK